MESAAKPNAGRRADRVEIAEHLEPEVWSGTMLSAAHHARYRLAAQFVAGKRVLDAGCGTGRGAVILSGAGAHEFVGVDIAPEAISTAMERYGSVASFTLGDLTALPFDSESFDVVVSFETIQHVADPVRALEELRRVVRPDGIVVVSAINGGAAAATNAHQVCDLTSGELAERLRRLFGHVRMLEQRDWCMSTVLEEADARSADVSQALPVELRKEVGTPAGSAHFAVALASDATLPEALLGVSVACNPGGPQEELHVPLQLELERAYARENALRRELNGLGERLWQTEERNQVELAKGAAELDGAHRCVVAMQTSFSWRITRPFRWVKSLFGRRS